MPIGGFASGDRKRGWDCAMEKVSSLPRANPALCTRCGACVEACPCHAIRLGEEGPVFACPEACRFSGQACTSTCEHVCVCEETCPTGAIECPFEIVLGGVQCSGDSQGAREQG